jgi:hypothetical protein
VREANVSAIDLSAAKTQGGPPPEPEQNVGLVQVVRKPGDPLVCPEMSKPQMMLMPPRVAGGQPSVRVETILIGCIGKDCAKWSQKRQGCGAMRD